MTATNIALNDMPAIAMHIASAGPLPPMLKKAKQADNCKVN